MTNVLVVVPVIAQEGVTSLVIPQINELVKRGTVVSLVVLSHIKLKNYKLNLPSERIYELGSTETYLSVKALLTAALFVRPLQQIIKREQVNKVIAHAPYSHFVVRLVKLTLSPRYELKLIQYFHFPQYLQFPNDTWRRKVFNSFIAKLAKKLDDVHVSVSNQVKSDIETNLVKLKAHHVLFNTLPPQNSDIIDTIGTLYEEWFIESSFKILLPGRLDHNKGQLFFLEVFKAFCDLKKLSKENVQLLIAGEGTIRKALENRIEAYGLEGQVKIAGELSHQAVLCCMRQCNLIVVPSVLEGMPLVVLEALSLQKPVLGSDTGGIREIIRHGETGYLFKVKDAEDCLQQVSYLYGNRNSRLIDKEMLEQDFKTKFSFNRHINQLLKLLETT